ncbi:MAG: L,D-transpeptidase family protein [Candidatus Omnitrophota bacterium]
MKHRIVLGIVVAVCACITVFSFMLFTNENKVNVSAQDKNVIAYNRFQELLAADNTDKAAQVLDTMERNYPDPEYTKKGLRRLASVYNEKGQYEKAVKYYGDLIGKYPDLPDAADIRSIINTLNMKRIVVSTGSAAPYKNDITVYTVSPGDTLYSIASRFNTTVAGVKQLNNLNGDMIMAGQKLKINVAQFSILVDKSENIMVLNKNGVPFKTYLVATGRNNSTPVGKFSIVDKMVKPPWTRPDGKIITADSEEYELGERWMPISVKGYGIHGTNDESSIGKQSTAGCVRMYNADVIELCDLVPRGTEVVIVNSMREKEEAAGPVAAPAETAGKVLPDAAQ